ncbi:MAG: HAD family hydrolase, partial [Planctomycetota bacterium]
CRTRREELETSIRLLPTVSKTLWELARRGLPLGIACNTTSPRETVTTRLQNLEIEGCFRALATSIEARASMPDPACYLAALDQLRLAPGEVAMVAHDTAVMAGAAALGMQVVAFNFDPDAEADLYLNRFDDLLTAVDLRQPLAAAG